MNGNDLALPGFGIINFANLFRGAFGFLAVTTIWGFEKVKRRRPWDF